ncbi:hypothetical protein ES705_08106 [subsurface metagenome]
MKAMAKIDKTNWLIDQIVYKLYGLTDEEIRIIDESYSGDLAQSESRKC